MRLLLLLSAFLTALTGAMSGTAAAAQPVVASASVSHSKAGSVAYVAVEPPEKVQGAFFAPLAWRAPAPLLALSSRDTFGERRLE